MNWIQPILVMLAAFVAVYLQVSVEEFRELCGTQFDLLPALVVFAALMQGVEMVALLSVCGGLWLDSLSANPLGVSILPYFTVGLAIYRCRKLLLQDRPYAQFVLGVCAGVLVPAQQALILFSLKGSLPVGAGFVWHLVLLALFSGGITPLVFRCFQRIDQILSYQPCPGPGIRPNRELKRGRL